MRAANVRMAARRVTIVRAALLLAFAGLAARAAHLAAVDRRGAERGAAQTDRVLTLAPERGTIFDRKGAELALTVDAPSVYAVPSALGDGTGPARRLARILGLDARALARRMAERDGFLFVARWVTPERARRVDQLEIPGVGVLEEPRRIYPHKRLAAPIVGFANIDGIGVRGVEQQEDDWLRGTARRLPVERDARGHLLVAGDARPRSSAGGDVALTIDTTLQADAEAALREAVRETGARGGVVISMDPHSGEILALAEAPSFDPNRFRDLDYRATRSRALLDATEPGSTLKAFLIAGALERRAVSSAQRFDCEQGVFQVPGKTIRDPRPHGELSTGEILRVSSNIGAAKIAFALGPRAHFEMLQRFGFGRSTGSGFPDESAGVLRSWRSWKPVDHATIAFGQGISVTPIQLAVATAVLANGGQRVRPQLVAARRVDGGSWQPTRPQVEGRVLSRQTAGAVLTMLEGVVSPSGTGRRARLRGVRVAGKTGTAQKFDPASGQYAADRFRAWFVGAVPAEEPALVIVVGLDEPRRPSHTGGASAAPLFARVAAAQLSRFGITTAPEHLRPVPAAIRTASRDPDPKPPAVSAGTRAEAPAKAQKDEAPVKATALAKIKAPAKRRPGGVPALARLGHRVLLPDFSGLTVAEVKRIAAANTLELAISGRGRAVSQEPPPGTVIARRDRVRVRFTSDPTPAKRTPGDGGA